MLEGLSSFGSGLHLGSIPALVSTLISYEPSDRPACQLDTAAAYRSTRWQPTTIAVHLMLSDSVCTHRYLPHAKVMWPKCSVTYVVAKPAQRRCTRIFRLARKLRIRRTLTHRSIRPSRKRERMSTRESFPSCLMRIVTSSANQNSRLVATASMRPSVTSLATICPTSLLDEPQRVLKHCGGRHRQAQRRQSGVASALLLRHRRTLIDHWVWHFPELGWVVSFNTDSVDRWEGRCRALPLERHAKNRERHQHTQQPRHYRPPLPPRAKQSRQRQDQAQRSCIYRPFCELNAFDNVPSPLPVSNAGGQYGTHRSQPEEQTGQREKS